jgi:hypothetical protein
VLDLDGQWNEMMNEKHEMENNYMHYYWIKLIFWWVPIGLNTSVYFIKDEVELPVKS